MALTGDVAGDDLEWRFSALEGRVTNVEDEVMPQRVGQRLAALEARAQRQEAALRAFAGKLRNGDDAFRSLGRELLEALGAPTGDGGAGVAVPPSIRRMWDSPEDHAAFDGLLDDPAPPAAPELPELPEEVREAIVVLREAWQRYGFFLAGKAADALEAWARTVGQ